MSKSKLNFVKLSDPIEVNRLPHKPAIYEPLDYSEWNRANGHRPKFVVQVPVRIIPPDMLSGLYVRKGHVMVTSFGRPQVMCYDVDRVVTALQQLDARNLSRNTYFHDKWLYVWVSRIDISAAAAPYDPTITHTLILGTVQVFESSPLHANC